MSFLTGHGVPVHQLVSYRNVSDRFIQFSKNIGAYSPAKTHMEIYAFAE
ncbi:hypothetical protein HMPREF1510_1264 [Streptococcus sp. ACC21]|nr:hypothetical protein HMPREF1510_1264 [Streptococcus sp. ACC21]EWC97581.1 hypothetical protein HMPREF1509_0184 [Streptococcus sp. AC15]